MKESGMTEAGEGSRYSWVVMGACVLLMAGFLGPPLCFGVFLKPLQDEFGWSYATVSGAMSLSMAVSGVVGILMGKITDKYDMSIVLSVGMLVGVGSFMLLALTGSLWQFYLLFGLGVGICTGCAYSPVAATISKWFVKRRALAMGVALTGIIVGQMTLSPIMNRIIVGDGWRKAFFVLAMITLACGLLGIVLLSKKPRPGDRPAKVGRAATTRPSRRGPSGC
jgi:MFS family permease